MLVKENIQIRPFDETNSVLQIDENRHLLINRATTELVKILSAATSLEVAHKVFNQSFNQTISMQSFRELVDEKLGGYQIILFKTKNSIAERAHSQFLVYSS
ncbi:MAG: hypothetical protein RLZZ197_1555 [Bacteroidota bacterium]